MVTCQKKVLALGAAKWKEAAGFGLANNVLTRRDVDILAVAASMPGRIPLVKQCMYPVNLLKRSEQR